MRFDTVSKYSKFRGKIFAETNKGTPWALGWKNALYIKHVFEAVIFYSHLIAEPDPKQPDHMTTKD